MVEISALFISFSRGPVFCFTFFNMGMRQEGMLGHDSMLHAHTCSLYTASQRNGQ